MEKRSQNPHLAILTSPGMGHLIPLTEFAKRVVVHHGFTATFITFSDFSSHAQTAFLDSLPAGLSYVTLPSIPVLDVPADAQVETRLCVMMQRSIPHLRAIIADLKKTTRLAAYVIDVFGGETLVVAKEFNLPHYLFCTSTFMFFSFMLYLPTLHETTSCEYGDLPEPVVLPGCVPIRGRDTLYPLRDRSDEACRRVVQLGVRFWEVEGVLVNSFVDLEPGAYAALKGKDTAGQPPVYPIGPLIRSGGERGGGSDSECLKWLENQPRDSVLFVSFGSGGTLSTKQMRELAWGLDESGQRFLWVVRCPSDKEANAAFFSLNNADDPLSYLPEGFLERTKDVGLVIRQWAPQIEVLRHASTGGFLTHCGWNSTLESLVNGVPMIAWPLYAEQRMNAVMLVEGVGAALRPRLGDDDGVVKREEIAKVVNELMEGEEGKRVRLKVEQLREAGAKALEKGGTSYLGIAEVAEKWKKEVA